MLLFYQAKYWTQFLWEQQKFQSNLEFTHEETDFSILCHMTCLKQHYCMKLPPRRQALQNMTAEDQGANTT